MIHAFVLLALGLIGAILGIGSWAYANKTKDWNNGWLFAGFLVGIVMAFFLLPFGLITYNEDRTAQLIEERYGVEVLTVDDPTTYLRDGKVCTAYIQEGGPSYILVEEDCESVDEIPREDELGKN